MLLYFHYAHYWLFIKVFHTDLLITTATLNIRNRTHLKQQKAKNIKWQLFIIIWTLDLKKNSNLTVNENKYFRSTVTVSRKACAYALLYTSMYICVYKMMNVYLYIGKHVLIHTHIHITLKLRRGSKCLAICLMFSVYLLFVLSTHIDVTSTDNLATDNNQIKLSVIRKFTQFHLHRLTYIYRYIHTCICTIMCMCVLQQSER